VDNIERAWPRPTFLDHWWQRQL